MNEFNATGLYTLKCSVRTLYPDTLGTTSVTHAPILHLLPFNSPILFLAALCQAPCSLCQSSLFLLMAAGTIVSGEALASLKVDQTQLMCLLFFLP